MLRACLVCVICNFDSFHSFTFKLRLISVVDVVGPMNPYQPISFHILSFAVFKSRILIYAGSRREKIVERNMDI